MGVIVMAIDRLSVCMKTVVTFLVEKEKRGVEP